MPTFWVMDIVIYEIIIADGGLLRTVVHFHQKCFYICIGFSGRSIPLFSPMISINVRKVTFSTIGVFVVSLVVEVALIFLVASGSFSAAFLQSNWFLIADAIVVNTAGIIIGLIWEKSTRARYLAKVESKPAPSERTKKIYKTVLIVAILIGVFYVLSNIWALYTLFVLNIVFTIPPATYTGFYITLVRYITLVLVFVWLYSEPEPSDASPILNTKKAALIGIVYFSIMTIFTIISLATFKVAAGTTSIQVRGAAAPLQNVVDGQGQEVSLGEIYPSLSQFSVVLPVGFKMVAYGGEQVVIAPASSSQDLSTSTGAYTVMVAPSTISPQDWAAGEGPVIQQSVNSAPDYGKDMSVVTSTTLFGNPAEEIFSIAGEQAGALLSFEQNGVPFVLGIEEASNISDPSLSVLNNSLNSIWKSLTFGGVATGNNPIPSSAISSVPPPAIPPVPAAPNNNSTASITILSPSGGETWQIGQEQTITWSSVGVKSVSIYIHFSNGIMCGVYSHGILPASPGKYSFVLTPTCTNGPTTLTPGQYTINISDSDPGNDDPEAWSQPFNIVAKN